MYELFEIGMLLCFAASWPFNIMKSYRSRTAAGKSVIFEVIVLVGYFLGVQGKFASGNINHVLAFYALDIALVVIDLLLCLRNRRLDRARGGKG